MVNELERFEAFLVTTLRQYSKKALTDNISNLNPLLRRIVDRKNLIIEEASGGVGFTERLDLKENNTMQAQGPYGLFNTALQAPFATATFSSKIRTGTIIFSHEEMMINSGKEKIVDFVKSLANNAINSFNNEVQRQLYNDGTDPLEIGGLALLVSDSPSSTVVGGLDPAIYPNWQNQTQTVSGTYSYANLKSAMNLLHQKISHKAGITDMIIAGTNAYAIYEGGAQDFQRTTNPDKGDVGYASVFYKNIPIFSDENCDPDRMYFLDSRFLKLKFKMQQQQEKIGSGNIDAQYIMNLEKRMPFDQASYMYPLISYMNLTTDNRRVQGVILP